MESEAVEPGLLRCDGCGTVTDRLFGARQTVKSLSLGKEIKVGDLICERCLQQLQEERTDEEIDRGPA